MNPVLSRIKDHSLRLLTNLRGWRTAEKLIVLESDDWGAIRTPSRAALDAMVRKGLPVDQSRFNCLDCLESGDDLEALLELLGRHRDGQGNPAVMTFNTVMGNPDFDAIRNDGFERFHHEHFFDSYRRYHGDDLRGLWQSGMAAGVIRPQLHAREHLNLDLWLRDLRAGREEARIAFDHGFFGTRSGTSSRLKKNYLAAYWAESADDLDRMAEILQEGMKLFQATFGFASRSFIPCNHILAVELEGTLADCGVTLLQGQRGQAIPDVERGGRLTVKRRYTGQRNRLGQVYSVRNVCFEPYKDVGQDWVGLALREIRQAFLFRRPAVVTTHRINYVGGMDRDHRDRNLRLLDELLARIGKTWSDVKFISSDELAVRMVEDQ